MTKKRLHFASEDLEMARRVAWLASDRCPSPESKRIAKEEIFPALIDALCAIDSAIRKGEDGRSMRKLEARRALVTFGLSRWEDSVSMNPDGDAPAFGRADEARLSGRLRRRIVRLERRAICRMEARKREVACVPDLRNALESIVRVLPHLAMAAQLRRGERRTVRHFGLANSPDPCIQVWRAFGMLQRALRLVSGWQPGSLNGLPAKKRAKRLDQAFLDLQDAGVTVEEIAFVDEAAAAESCCGESGWDAMRKRLNRARVG